MQLVLHFLQFPVCEVSAELSPAQHREPSLGSSLGLTPRQSLELQSDFFSVEHEVLLLLSLVRRCLLVVPEGALLPEVAAGLVGENVSAETSWVPRSERGSVGGFEVVGGIGAYVEVELGDGDDELVEGLGVLHDGGAGGLVAAGVRSLVALSASWLPLRLPPTSRQPKSFDPFNIL